MAFSQLSICKKCSATGSEGRSGAEVAERREMLGIVDQLRSNGLAHSPATRTRRCSRIRITLQRVLGSAEGQKETVTDVLTLYKNSPDSTGLSGKNISY